MTRRAKKTFACCLMNSISPRYPDLAVDWAVNIKRQFVSRFELTSNNGYPGRESPDLNLPIRLLLSQFAELFNFVYGGLLF